jgi:ketosteroid isomerase-like protein
MNNKYWVLGLLVAVACQPKFDDNELRSQVLETDKSFSRMAGEKGNAEAFIYYADEMVIKMQQGDYPIVGKFALMQSLRENSWNDLKLTWEPLRAEASGHLGYTFGTYSLETKTADGLRDTTLYGNYVSVWKRKRDGSWRYIVDGGNVTPGPVSLKR